LCACWKHLSMKELLVETKQNEEFIDITDLVNKSLSSEKIKEGILHIFVPHATAGLIINENADPNVSKDILNLLNKIVPKGKWLHDKVDSNGDAHIKSSLIGNSVSIPVKDGKLCLGTWQDIFLCEFDGPRQRKIILNLIPIIK